MISPVLVVFVLSYSNDRSNFVYIDQSSGGYPSATLLERATFFYSKQKAIDYAKHWPGKFRLETLELRLRDGGFQL
jgi:hypothetical protein